MGLTLIGMPKIDFSTEPTSLLQIYFCKAELIIDVALNILDYEVVSFDSKPSTWTVAKRLSIYSKIRSLPNAANYLMSIYEMTLL